MVSNPSFFSQWLIGETVGQQCGLIRLALVSVPLPGRWYCDNLRKIVSNNPKRAQLQHKLVHLPDSTSTSSCSPIQLNYCNSLLPVQLLYYSSLTNPLPTQLLNYSSTTSSTSLHQLNWSTTSSTAELNSCTSSWTTLLSGQLLY
jgi:hypothetical protein